MSALLQERSEVAETADESDEKATEKVQVEKEMRYSSLYMGCVCTWNASLPVMKVSQDIERVVVHHNKTGEIPTIIAPDTIYRVKTIPSPVLGEVHQKEILSLIRPLLPEERQSDEELSKLSFTLPKESSYAKEMRSQLYKAFKVKPSDTILSEIGMIARRHQESQTDEFVFSLTREFDRMPMFYLNADSCYYGYNAYKRSMCHCKRYGAFYMLKHPKETQEGSLAALYSDWEDSIRRHNVPCRMRSLVIPVTLQEKQYRLCGEWESSLLSRFVVTNTYENEEAGDERNHGENYSCYSTHMASLLTKVLSNANLCSNASLSYASDYFYINGGESVNRRMPTIHIGREVTRKYPLSLSTDYECWC